MRPGRPPLDPRETPLIRATLEAELSRMRGRHVRIRHLHRDTSSRSSSFRTERLLVITDGDEPPLSIYFKDLHPEHQVTQSWALRRTDRMPSIREIRMYRSVLSERFGTLRFYGSRWEPAQGRCWLFIEDVGQQMLQGAKTIAPWADACRWAARFHVATGELPAAQTAFLPVYDEDHYRRCAHRVERMLDVLNGSPRALVRRGLEHFTASLASLGALPRCVIHGQFFGKNIMLRPPPAAHPIAVIDWETAAIGPGLFDLASISSGKWTAEQRLAMWQAYREAYQSVSGRTLPWEEFHRAFIATAVFHALDWLVFWSQHPEPSQRFPKFLRELETLLDGGAAAVDTAPRARSET